MTPPEAARRWTDAARAYLSRTTPVVPPIYQCTTFELDDASYRDIAAGGGFEQTWYTRFGNPTVAYAADAVARLEGGEAAVMTSSGMGAIATTLLATCRAGDRVVAARELYGDTRDLLVRDLPALGVRVDLVAAADLGQWRAALAAGPAAVAYAESLSNPQLRVLDIPRVAELAHRRGARLVVDNTFASAFAVQPLALGADVVVHSATKFLNGHSDVVAGAVVADAATVREATSLGGVETLISAPHNSSQFSYTAEELDLAGIRPGMVRLSLGLEPAEALVADLGRALAASAGHG